MRFRYPVILFLSFVAACAAAASAHFFTSRFLLRDIDIPASAASIRGLTVPLAVAPKSIQADTAAPRLPQWELSPPELNARPSVETPSPASPAPSKASTVLGGKLAADLPLPEIPAPDMAPLTLSPPERPSIAFPQPPQPALPPFAMERPSFPPASPKSLRPPDIPTVSPKTALQDILPIKVDLPPAIDIAVP
ncbi:MAG: hypothetical protein JW909_05640 [Planctomycetes bacterium]|nr:hypothetical protein [Planctomycetota bacterium]